MKRVISLSVYALALGALLVLSGCPDKSGKDNQGNGDKDKGAAKHELLGTWSFDVESYEAWLKKQEDYQSQSEEMQDRMLKMAKDDFGSTTFKFSEGKYEMGSGGGETRNGTWSIKEKEDDVWVLEMTPEGKEEADIFQVSWTDAKHIVMAEVKDGQVDKDDPLHFSKN